MSRISLQVIIKDMLPGETCKGNRTGQKKKRQQFKVKFQPQLDPKAALEHKLQ